MSQRKYYGRLKDVITHEHIAAHPEIYKCKVFSYHPNLSQITSVDLRSRCPPVYDQGNLGSCTANALCGAYSYEMMKQGETDMEMSRLFLYYEERSLEGTVSSDSGAQIKDGVSVLQTSGVCRESIWPYNVALFAHKPSVYSFMDAKRHHAIKTQRVAQDLYDIKQSLLDGIVITFGFTVYASFESADVAKTGMVPMPDTYDEVLGGHAVVAVGYDDSKQVVIVRNSWGKGWGDKGYFYLPYEYITNSDLASDFWSLQLVKDN